MRCLLPICSRLVVNLLGLVPFLSRLYLKSYGPDVDRGLSVVTREGRAICLLVPLCLRMVLTVNYYCPESLVPLLYVYIFMAVHEQSLSALVDRTGTRVYDYFE